MQTNVLHATGTLNILHRIDSVSVIEEWTALKGKSFVPLKRFTGSRSIAKEVPECKDNQQLSGKHPEEDTDEEQCGNNPLRHPERTGGLNRTHWRPFLP